MANFLQKIANAVLGTHFGERPPAPPAPPEAPTAPRAPTVPRETLQQRAQRVQRPPEPPQRGRVIERPAAPLRERFTLGTRVVRFRGEVPADNYHPEPRSRTLDIPMTRQQRLQYFSYLAQGKEEKAKVYALAEVYGAPALARATWDEDFDYDEEDVYDWPDYDDSDTAGFGET